MQRVRSQPHARAAAGRFTVNASSFRAYVVLGCMLLPSAHTFAEPPGDALERVLAQIGATADRLDHALPSFTCRETGTTEVRQGRKVREHASFSATLRARRVDTGAHNESFALTELNGEPYTGGYVFPFYVSGGFDKGMRYFAPALQACYQYKLAPGRIDFATAPDAAQHPGCRDEGIRGFALLDHAGNVTHLERRVSQEAVDAYRLAPFTAIDFGPVELNGETFRLAQHMLSEHSYERTSARFEVTYSECRLFHVTVTLSDPTVSGKEPPSSAVAAPR